MILTTADQEYTVFFSTYHEHYTPYSVEEEERELLRALDFVRGLLEERIVVVSYYKDGQLAMSTRMAANESPDKDARHTKIESWRDSHTREIYQGG